MKLIQCQEYDPEEFRFWHKKLHRFINHKKLYVNTVVSIGRNIVGEMHVPVARRTYSGDGLIAWGALGNDATAPTIGDTFLGNETYRKAINDSSCPSSILNVLTLWGLTEANAQHYEAGEFIDGSVSLDTGNLFARWNIDELKVSTETMSIDSNYTITQ